jgi:anti-anti-sigma factor
MSTPQGILRYHHDRHTLTLRVEGRGTLAQSASFRRFVERAMEAGTTLLRLDLRDCSYMDSTFLGTILTLKKLMDRKNGEVTLLAPSVPCCKILQQMGLLDVFPQSEEKGEPQPTWTELTCQMDEGGLFRTNVTQAHQELANLPGKAGEEFKEAAKSLSRDDPAD